MNNIIAIAADHGGVKMKEELKSAFPEFAFLDLGTNEAQTKVDYPKYAFALSIAVANKEAMMGILICKSGIGMSIAANRHPKIRAALCYESNLAILAREHNDANVLVLGAAYLSNNKAKEITKAFLHTKFLGAQHQIRVEQLG
jgi:ribose 5-phosphate isomerase B